MRVREKLIKSGNLFEAEFYPITSDGKKFTRGLKKNKSSQAQKQLNSKNALKNLLRLIETNFRAFADYYITFTYKDGEMPSDYPQVKRDINNFFRRVRRLLQKQSLPELKYIYVIERKLSKRTGLPRWHIHMVMSGDLDRRAVRDCWKFGDIKKVDELQPSDNGYEALATYLSKEWNNELLPADRKRYTPSRNLKQPEIKPKDGVFSQHYLEKLCKQRVDDKDYWERRYKGYRFISAEPEYNEDFGYWYLAVTLRAKE